MNFCFAFWRKRFICCSLRVMLIPNFLNMFACFIRHFMDLNRPLEPGLKGSLLICSILAFLLQEQMRIYLFTSMVHIWFFFYSMWMTLSLHGTILPSLLLLFNCWVLILISKILVFFTTFLGCRLTILILVCLFIKLCMPLIC